MIRLHVVDPDLGVHVAGGDFEPPPDVEALVTRHWEAACAANPALFDGRFFHILRHAPDRIEGCFVPYRYWMAQRQDERLRARLDLRPLAVTGITRVEDLVLLGRRAAHTTQDAGLFELVPAGTLSPEARDGDQVDLRRQLLLELEEEIGLAPSAVTSVDAPRWLAEDIEAGVFDLVLPLVVDRTRAAVEATFAAHARDETTELRWLGPGGLARAAEAEDVAPVSRAILAALAAAAR